MLKRSKPADGTVKITFTLPMGDPGQPLAVLGDFNDWDPLAHPFKKRSNGTRSAVVEMAAGRTYHFKYLAGDGSWFNEDDADWFEANEYGEVNSVLQT